MNYFYSLRGWLELDEDEFPLITSLLETLQSNNSINTKEGLYLQGWNCNNPTLFRLGSINSLNELQRMKYDRFS